MLQTVPKINLREERDFGSKLNATFHFIKANFKPLLRTLFLYVTPVALVSGILSGLYQARLMQKISGTNEYETYADLNFFEQVNSLNYYFVLFFGLVSVLVLMLAVHCFIVVYQDEEGEVHPEAVWQLMKPNLIKVIYSGVAIALIVVFSLALLGLGVYLAFVMSLFVMVMVREESGFIETTERCFYLIKGHWWATFGFLLIVGFIQGVISWIPALPTAMLPMLRMLGLPGTDSDVLLVVVNTISTVVSVYIYAISAVAVSFQYYNLVEIKDGIGLMEQADMIGRQNLGSTANEGYY